MIRAIGIALSVGLLGACGGSPSDDRVASSGTTSPFVEGAATLPDADASEQDGGPASGTDGTSASTKPDQKPGAGPKAESEKSESENDHTATSSSGIPQGDGPLPGSLSGTYQVPKKAEDAGSEPPMSSGTPSNKREDGSGSYRVQRPGPIIPASPTPSGPGFIPAELLLWILQASKLVEVSLGPGWYPSVDGDRVAHWMPFEDRLALVVRNVNSLEDQPKVLTTSRVATPVALRKGIVVAALDPAFDPALATIADDAALELFKLSVDGEAPQRLTTNKTIELTPALSPDGARLAYAGYLGSDYEIVVMGLSGARPLVVTDNGWDDLFPTWSPGGTHLAYSALQGGDYEITAVEAASGAIPVQLTNNAVNDVSPTWSTTGISFSTVRGEDFDMVRISGTSRTASALTGTAGDELFPASSLDGSKMVFTRQR